MDPSNLLVVFTLVGRQLALPVAVVERIVRAVEVTPVPQRSEMVLGVINLQGRIIPVLDIRTLFGSPRRELEPSDQLIIAQSPTRTVALVAEGVSGVVEYEENDAMEADAVLPGLGYIQGVVKRGGETILICSLDQLLFPEIEKTLHEALEG